ncbi:MAG: hypothetical protein HXK63_06360 [Campylobacter sp.]|nr:hypothetical protein [Campylobacter sp.]
MSRIEIYGARREYAVIWHGRARAYVAAYLARRSVVKGRKDGAEFHAISNLKVA